MGKEAEGKRLVGTKWVSGRAFLETDEFVFRGEARCRIPFKDVTGIHCAGSRLEITTPTQRFVFELQTDTANWATRIQNPKGRLEKLGLRPKMRVSLHCISDDGFRRELADAGIEPTTYDQGLDAVFVGAGDRSDLADFVSWKRRIAPTGCVWVVYPKGRKEITEADVLSAGRKAALRDVKVMRFSQTHTALKFVVPSADR